MECKCFGTRIPEMVYTELIETLWNVNVYSGAGSVVKSQELIETLWNVNYIPFYKWVIFIYELIETLWNVND